MFEKLKNKIQNKRMNVKKIEDIEVSKYLSEFTCNNCHNRCSLNNIKCGGGLKLRDEKIKLFKMKDNI